MSRVLSAPRCSTRSTACRRTSSATASVIRSRPEHPAAVPPVAVVAAIVVGLLAASPGFPLPPAQEDPPSLAEAARRHRARIEASREQRGAAPRFTDADLAGGRSPGPDPPPPPLETEPLRDPPITGEDLPLRDPGDDLPLAEAGEDTTEAGDDEVRANLETRRGEIAEREYEIRERLLDIEASLAAVGASGLPYAPRNPTRFQSALDTTRLRAEQQELNQELEALAAERQILR